MTEPSKKAILCPHCGKLVSRDEARCPHCGADRPGARWKAIARLGGANLESQIISTLIAVNVGMYLLSLLLYGASLNFLNPMMALSPSSRSLLLLGASGTIPIDRLGNWWSLVSAGYLHGSLLHIVFNMIAIKHLGTLTLQAYGSSRMILIYTLANVAGYAASYLAGVRFTIGASAAICGLIGAMLYYGKSRGGLFGEALFKQVSGWLVGLFIIGLMPNINNWGHGAGILCGIALGFLLGYPERRPDGFLHKAGAALCILVTLLVLIQSVASGIWYRIFG
ncbi:rhomboid family intramembrane serine protease [Desulfococcus sp.]|uniref:rhomboid family intramembrane serine protease n=1 Tax=Desulfococcus sp. TaxID=2025834 RepID=UPI0035947800